MGETLDEFQDGLQNVGRIVKNLRYAVDIILSATTGARDPIINVDKTKVTARDGIPCRILIQSQQLEQVDTFPYLGSLITVDGECMTEFHTSLNRAGDRGITAENMER